VRHAARRTPHDHAATITIAITIAITIREPTEDLAPPCHAWRGARSPVGALGGEVGLRSWWRFLSRA
jgi:hypothetical protein